MAALNNISISLLAPTGMAANRMSRSTNKFAQTIHSFFRKGRVRRDTLIVIDEASMVSSSVLVKLLQKIRTRCRIVFVGDANQLPSIEYGQVLRDLIKSNCFPVVYLTKTFRFNDDIGTLATCVLNGETTSISEDVNSSTAFISCEDDTEIADNVGLLMKRFNNAQVLTPIKGGEAGAKNLNIVLSKLFNLAHRDNELRVGVDDRVINTKNDYEANVLNGSNGTVIAIANNEITVDYDGIGLVTKLIVDANS